MKKFCKKGHPARSGKRWLAILMSVCLIGTMIPISARAENSSPETGLCEHHTEHTTECGYVAPTEGHECGHVHDEECGYQEASECTHVHTEACGENGESCIHEHDDECGYAEGHECGHVHDEECGYVEASEGSPCTYICKICEAQALINALPDAGDITEESFDEVSDMLGEIDTAKEALTAEESEALDFTKYEAAVAKMMELMGQAGAPAAITILAASGSDPVTPDTPAAPVNGKGLGVSIIADPTAPADTSSDWAGSFVYFGTYNSSPVKYRVLDRTTTDFGGTTMLLDCDSILWKGRNPSSQFDDNSTVWADSEIKTYLNGTFLSGNFTDLEQAAIAASSKANASATDGNGWRALNYAALSGEQIFLLDAKEATNTSYGYSNTQTQAANRKKTDYWWLRSASATVPDDGYAGCVHSNGSIQNNFVSVWTVGASPALNVNLSSVIFSSVLSGTSGQPEAEYKLTLHDGNMTITPGTVTRDSGDEVTVPYTIGGTNGDNATRVSLMVLDKEYTAGNTNGAKLVAYEKLADAGSTRGTFTLTDDMKNGSYYYYIVAEDVNDGNVTDYASEPVQITIPASKYTVTVTNGTLSDGSTTGEYAQGETVTITAGAAPDGQQFKEWEVVSGSITLASSTSKTTTFTMPAGAVSVKANYEAIPVTAPGITTQPGNVTVKEDETATFTIVASRVEAVPVAAVEAPATNKPGTTKKPAESKQDTEAPFIKGENGKEGWDVIRDEVNQTQEGKTVTVDMNGSTVVPGDVLDEIKGKDITIVFDMGNGITWSVNGQSITADRVSDIDFTVKTGTNTIPVDIINNVTGERYSTQISLAYDGEFGFTAVLSINVDAENAGLYANLFYYNETTGELEFICADEIAADGIAELTFTHASDYAVVIDTEPMDKDADEADGDKAEASETGNDSTHSGDGSTQNGTEAADSTWNPLWLLLIGAVVIVIGLGVFLVVKKKKSEDE
ncbi:MAG: DUF6273 domain-containing protein [Suilimivivens sp.]